MAINIKFDLAGNPEPPTIILAKRNGNKLGKLEANQESIELNDKLNDASEFSFTLHKYVDNRITNLWDEVTDFKLVYCKEWDMWFEITVELDEETETVKTVMCTQLGQAELSQIMLYDIHINEEGDSNWNTENKEYKSTILYCPEDTSISLLHRLLKDKAPHYSIIHVDDTIKNIQRTFSFDDTSIYDAFMEIAEEIGCLFIFHSNSDENGNIQRTISVYDLQQNCMNTDCAHRGEFIDECPKCGSTNIRYGYGDDTTIFVTADELAASGIQLTTDTDAVKNCFKLEAGDDLMTATVINCNPNGTPYIWYFSDAVKADMSDELVDRIESYDSEYNKYYNDYKFNLDVTKYNELVNKYSEYNEELETIPSTIKGYSSLMNAYYNVIDLGLYLESGLMPSIEMSETSAEEQVALLTRDNLSPVAVAKLSTTSLATANSTVLAMAKTVIKSTYKIEVGSSELSSDKKTWKGNFIVTNYSDEEDMATSSTISITLNDDEETFIKQKIDKALNKVETDDYSIAGLFKKELKLNSSGKHVVSNGSCTCEFCAELKKYALNPLISFNDACQSCIDILVEQDAGNKNINKDLYEKLYLPYYRKLQAIQAEIKIRENEVNSIKGVYDVDNKLIKDGFQQKIEKLKNKVKDALDFEVYLGEDLWLEFCSYRREDKYENSNYISDGLNNAELFEKASEFIKVAKDEIYKSAELQHSISSSLKNLLAIPKFKPLVEYFNVGNWIRILVNEQIYKLRLLEYGISFGSFDEISVDFSDVTKIRTGITDVQEILAQASSMATSYSSVQKQASQGEKGNNVLENWIENGLDATNTKIMGNAENQNQVLDNHGFLCRQYDPITDSYNDEQLKIINSTIAITDDNWESIKTALGKYYYIDPITGEEVMTYGVIGETIVGKMLLGESLGLYNEDNSLSFDENGLVVKNSTNTFSVNPNSNSLITVLKDDTPTLSFDENGNLKIIGEITASKLTLDPDIKIEADNISGLDNISVYVKKDGTIGSTPTEGSTGFIVSSKGLLEASNAVIYGKLYSSEGRIGGFDIKGSYLANNTASLSGASNSVYLGTDGISCGTKFEVTKAGKITAKDGFIGGWCIDSTKIFSPAEGSSYTTIKTTGDVAFASGSPSPSDATNAKAKIYHNGNVAFGYDGSVYNFRVNDSTVTIRGDITCYDEIKFKSEGKTDASISMKNKTLSGSSISIEDGMVSGLIWTNTNPVLSVSSSHNFYLDTILYAKEGVVTEQSVETKNISCSNEGVINTLKTADAYVNGFLSCWGRVYLQNNTSFRGMKKGKTDVNTDDSNIIAFVNENNRVILGSSSNSAPTELRSPSSVYFKCSGTTLDDSRYTLQWTKLNVGTTDSPKYRGVLRPTYDTENGETTSYSNLGSDQHRWRNLYITSDSVITSDRNKKKNIASVSDKYLYLFDCLNPVTYQMIDGDRTHVGFISQEVEESLIKVGLTAEDFGGFCKDAKIEYDDRTNETISILDENGNQEYSYSLRYGEFIALNTAKIKQLERKLEQAIDIINEQQSVIEELKNKVI